MQPNIIERVWRQDKMVNVDVLNGFTFTDEEEAHRFIISGKNVNTPVYISGTITANFKNADGVLVPLTGTIEDGKAVVVLSRECYAVEGPFSLMIFADTVCIYAAIANAINSSGEVIAYPTASIPSIQELIEEAQDVIASIPQDYSALNQSVTDLKSATFYKIIVGANAIVPTIRNSTLTYGISGPRVTATYRLVDGANKLIDTIETTTLNSSTAGQSATQRLLYVVWNVTTHKMEIVASLAYNAENIYIIGYYNEATADGTVYQSPFPYYNTDFPADNKTLQDDVQDLKSVSLTAQQKQMLVGLFSSTANTGHASGDPVLAGTYVLKCDVATATGSGSMFTFKWVKES